MRVVFYSDPGDFDRIARQFLLKSEAENCVLLGLLPSLLRGVYDHFWTATVEHDGEVLGCALQTMPYHPLITRMPDTAVVALADALWERYPRLAGVNAVVETAEPFAQLWQQRTSMVPIVEMAQGIYELTQVKLPEPLPPGSMRSICGEDLSFLDSWIDGFYADTGLVEKTDTGKLLERSLAQQSLFLWEDDGQPVSSASWAGRTPNGVRINGVYTPAEHRGRGYASALVGQLSQRLLDEGQRFCFLYTDLANPTSNGLYQRLGYRQVCSSTMIRFCYGDESDEPIDE